MTGDLFDPNRTMMTKESMRERAKGGRTGKGKRKGYAYKPGTGPEGETCGSCVWKVNGGTGKGHFLKCHLIRANWTASYGTDIEARFPSCREWKQIPPELIALRKALRSIRSKCPKNYSSTSRDGKPYYYYSSSNIPLEPAKVALLEEETRLFWEIEKMEKEIYK